MFKDKKFHYAGKNERGSHVITECTKDEDSVLTVTLDDARPGQPLRLGETMCQLAPTEDGHLEVDVVDTTGSGPPAVATAAYRSGWDRTFKSKTVN